MLCITAHRNMEGLEECIQNLVKHKMDFFKKK